jgi:hypothetical protein
MCETNFFTPGPASEIYMFNRDSPNREDVREYCEALWRRYEPLNGDPHFLSDARNNFHSRTWEMILTCALLDRGYPLVRPPSDGPDICIAPRAGSPTVWIEAVIVELGSGGDHAGRVTTERVGDHGALFNVQPEKTILRYTSALATKTRQLDEFRRRKVVAPDDIYVVAINGALLDDYTSADTVPEVMRSVYPLGDAYFQYSIGQEPPRVEYGHYFRDHVGKVSGTQIPTDSFLSGRSAGVSALLYSKTSAWNPQPRCLDYVSVIHNYSAANRLPIGYFTFGREAILEAERIRWQQHDPIDRPMLVDVPAPSCESDDVR